MVKKILITGASSGIGKEILEYFLKKNYFVIAISRSKINTNYKNFDFFKCNLNKEKEISLVVKKVIKKHKSIDFLINNAGVSFQGYNITNFKKNLSVNLIAPFYICSLLRKNFKKDGCIINISSVCGSRATPNNPGYNSSKAGLNMLSKSMALDFAPDIRVNTLSLGYFNTRLNKKSFLNKEKNKMRANLSMLGKWGEIREVPKLIEFICSKDATFLTGSNIFLDGGWHSKGMRKS